jgi:hypothetical protein
MDESAKKAEASLLQPREGAGKYWWETFVRGHISDINRRFNQAKALYITTPTEAPIGLFSYIREAALCFEIGRYLPAISLASQSAEMILERDRRTRSSPALARREDERIALCSRNLSIAGELGLPTEALLSPDESLDQDAPIRFVERSDRVARGDVSGWFRAISEYLPVAEHDALDQLEKAQRFVVTWFNSSPDVQREHR